MLIPCTVRVATPADTQNEPTTPLQRSYRALRAVRHGDRGAAASTMGLQTREHGLCRSFRTAAFPCHRRVLLFARVRSCQLAPSVRASRPGRPLVHSVEETGERGRKHGHLRHQFRRATTSKTRIARHPTLLLRTRGPLIRAFRGVSPFRGRWYQEGKRLNVWTISRGNVSSTRSRCSHIS